MFVKTLDIDQNLSIEDRLAIFDRRKFIKLYDIVVKINRNRIIKHLKIERKIFFKNWILTEDFNKEIYESIEELSSVINNMLIEFYKFNEKRRKVSCETKQFNWFSVSKTYDKLKLISSKRIVNGVNALIENKPRVLTFEHNNKINEIDEILEYVTKKMKKENFLSQ